MPFLLGRNEGSSGHMRNIPRHLETIAHPQVKPSENSHATFQTTGASEYRDFRRMEVYGVGSIHSQYTITSTLKRHHQPENPLQT